MHFTNLDDLLADDLVVKVMRADRVDPAALRTEFGRVARRLAPQRLAIGAVRFGCEPRPLLLATPRPGAGVCEPRLCC
jgi:hypothetical protein